MKSSFIILLCVLCGLFAPCHAQSVADSIQGDFYPLYFGHDKITIDENYLDNGKQLERLRSMLSKPSIDSVTIYAYSSPDGTQAHNMLLSRQRAEFVRDFILANLPQNTTLTSDNIHLFPMGEHWKGLTEELEANYHLLNRDRVLKIMYADVPGDTKKWRLRNLDNGFTYSWIIQHHMPLLRVATWIGIHTSVPEVQPDTTPVIVPEPEPEPLPVQKPDTIVPVVEMVKKSGLKWALKSNLLYDAALVPNIGAEFYLGKQISIATNLHYAWWNTDNWYWRTYGAELAVRKWFGKSAKENPLTGHHIGVYGQALTYDFLVGGNKGYMSGNPGDNIFDHANYIVGLEYGYSLPIARKLNLDFVIGVGYHGGRYNEYRVVDDCYVWQAYKKRGFFGPTKAEITLSWLLGRGNQNVRKGGAR